MLSHNENLPASSFVRTYLSILAASAAVTLLTGCVTRGYKLADRSALPVVPLEITSAPVASANPSPSSGGDAASAVPSTASATVHTVIVYQGPGSWKREAYWDEYVVSLVNRGETPLVISTAMLSSTRSGLL